MTWYMDRLKETIDESTRVMADNFLALAIFQELERRKDQFQALDTQGKPTGEKSVFAVQSLNGSKIRCCMKAGRRVIDLTLQCHYYGGNSSVHYLLDSWPEKHCWEFAASSCSALGPDVMANTVLRNLGFVIAKRRKK